MKIEEFITYFEEESKEHTNLVPYDVDEEYNRNCRQLAEWLKELKAYREAREEIGCLPIVWEEGAGIRKCIDILDKHLREVNADE